ncbi:ABC transporter substrate-binding protein [Devosia sp. 2618]|uniref:ABC transporter substrate-binding protein n=1 Tax=Devosia sp. 2618 TaxID=3156454 RepID=UPI0033920929
MSISLNRRRFALGTAGLGLSALLPMPAFAQETRSVTTVYGTYDIPADPKRVVAIDSRLDLQPALALGLPVIGYGHSVPGKWVPVPEGLEFYGSEVNIEQVLAGDPDLVICADYDPDSPWWPSNKLRTVVPVVPTDTEHSWKQALQELATVLGLDGAADKAIGEYDALVAEIKARHGDKLSTKTVVSIQPGEGVLYLMNGPKMLVPQVLADLGVKTVLPAEGQDYNSDEIAAEAFANVLGDVDGALVVTGLDELNVLDGDAIWSRLPFVQAGATVASNGNINYGSIYSAIYVAKLVDALYSKIA